MILWSLLTIITFISIRKIVITLKLNTINPIIVTLLFLIASVVVTGTPYEEYERATHWITYMLGPIVVMLAIPLYKNETALKRHFKAVMVGVATSFIVSVLSVIVLSFLLKLDNAIMTSMLPKSITTPMALEVTKMTGGLPGLTVIFVIITGIVGASLAPWTMSLFKVRDPIAKGIGIGASSHGIGTSKAVEMDDEVGAASGLSMGICGVTTVVVFSLLMKFI